MKVDFKDIQKMQDNINHLKGKIKQTYNKPCHSCKSKIKYSERYDSYYCSKCSRWTEAICGDRKCSYCKSRPKYPTGEIN